MFEVSVRDLRIPFYSLPFYYAVAFRKRKREQDEKQREKQKNTQKNFFEGRDLSRATFERSAHKTNRTDGTKSAELTGATQRSGRTSAPTKQTIIAKQNAPIAETLSKRPVRAKPMAQKIGIVFALFFVLFPNAETHNIRCRFFAR